MAASSDKPLRIISSVAPIRIADFGGWTDTWFAKRGRVLNIAVYPYAEVQIHVFPRGDRPQVAINAENYGERFTLESVAGPSDRHALLRAAIDYMGVPQDLALEITIHSEAPAGCSTGTSAAVSVALIGALDRLSPGYLTPHEAAAAAHRVETELLKRQCGVQDQLASAYGGISYIEILDYPHSIVSPITLPNSIWWELERRLSLVFVGEHDSSEVHKMVIQELEAAGPQADKLAPLRETPVRAKNALYAGDFRALGRAMIENTEAQSSLHPDLVGPRHKAVIEIAQRYGAVGWKVNGAGGDGGSVTVLSGPDSAVKRAMLAAIRDRLGTMRDIPIYLSRFGLRVWESPVG